MLPVPALMAPAGRVSAPWAMAVIDLLPLLIEGGDVEIVRVVDAEGAAGERDRSLEVVAGPGEGDVGGPGIDDRGAGDEDVGGLGDGVVAVG